MQREGGGGGGAAGASYQPITSVGVSGDETERWRPGPAPLMRGRGAVCKQTAADRVYACHNRSGP